MTQVPHESAASIPLDMMAKSIARIEERIDRHRRADDGDRAVIRTVGGSIQLTGATGIVEVSQRPAAGRIWNILKAVLTSADGHTPLSGVIVDLYSSTMPDPGAPVLDALIQGGLAVPSVTYYSRKVEWCLAHEEIFGLIYGGASGQQVNLAVRVAEYPSSAVESQVIR